MIRQRFQFQNLAQEWLPAAYDPIHINASGSSLRYDPRTSMLVDSELTDPGLTYDVLSRAPAPTFEQLNGIQSLGGALRQAKNYLICYSRLKEKRLGKDAKLAGASTRSAWAFTLWGDPTLKMPRPSRPPRPCHPSATRSKATASW